MFQFQTSPVILEVNEKKKNSSTIIDTKIQYIIINYNLLTMHLMQYYVMIRHKVDISVNVLSVASYTWVSEMTRVHKK
jgi:hypothetical protein